MRDGVGQRSPWGRSPRRVALTLGGVVLVGMLS